MLRQCRMVVLAMLLVGVGAAAPRGAEAHELRLPNSIAVPVGDQGPVAVRLSDTAGVARIEFRIAFDPAVCQFAHLSIKPPFDSWDRSFGWDDVGGTFFLSVESATPLGAGGLVTVAEVYMEAVGAVDASSTISFDSYSIQDELGAPIEATATEGTLWVVEPALFPPRLDFGDICQGATVEGSLRLQYVEEITSVTKPDWITIRYQEAGVPGGYGWGAPVHFTLDASALGAHTGEMVFETDQGTLTFPVTAQVHDPALAGARVLAISSPFTAFSTLDPSTYQTFLDVVADTQANIDYLEGDKRVPCAPLPADLTVYDGILLTFPYLMDLRTDSPDLPRLVAYARDNPDRRLMLFSNAGLGWLVEASNYILDNFGLHVVDVREETCVLTGDNIGDDPLVAGVEQITLHSPSPIDVADNVVLLHDPTDPVRAHAAVSRGASEVIAFGFDSYAHWLAQDGADPNDAVQLMTNLLSFPPAADFAADPARGVAPLTVQFTDLSRRAPSEWQWRFGDGATSTAQDPAHEYASPGTYTVALSASNAAGSDTETRERFVLVTFPDVPLDPEHWALYQILACVDAGVVQGYPGGNYGPDGTVNRGQMAIYMARALAHGDDLVPDGPATPSFTDVSADHSAYKYVEYCLDQGIVQGYWDGYRPDEVVNRGQMAVYIARSVADPLGDPGVPEVAVGTIPAFSDVTADNDWAWCYKYVQYIATLDPAVVQGYADGTYHPERQVTRDQMAVYVARAFELPM